jgi:hypothetical protein
VKFPVFTHFILNSELEHEIELCIYIYVQGCGEGPADQARITSPMALVETSDGIMYFADNNFIRKLENGIVSTLAGMPRLLVSWY